jgi:hypothetical protein
VSSNVSGAWILLDSTTKKGWVTPHVFSLAPGTYTVALNKPGYKRYEETVNVRAGRTTEVEADLAAEDNKGQVIVETVPSGLAVHVDGKPYGPSPTLASLSPGRHELEVSPPPGQLKYVGPFEMRPRTLLRKTIHWSLDPEKAGPSTRNSQSQTE